MNYDPRALNAKFNVHPMADPKIYRERPPLILKSGDGCFVTDIDGRRLLDTAAGLWNITVGHNRREVKEAITAQLDELAYYPTQGISNPPAIELSARLAEMFAWEGMTKVLFSSGGGDACEGAIKLARQYWKLSGEPQRTKIISLRYAYHGTHFGGMSANGNPQYRAAYEPLMPGFIQVESPFLYRNPFSDDPQTLGRICAELLDREIQYQGAGTVAAFMAEPIQGAGGLIVPPANYWPLVREICDRHGVLLVSDEVVTGFGRPGTMSGARLWNVKPDIMCFAKGINAGYVPLGATMWNDRVAKAWEAHDPLAPIMHGYTYSGHALACAAANATLDIVVRENLAANAAREGEHLLAALADLPKRYAFVGDVRGKGLMVAVEFVRDQRAKTPFETGAALPRRVFEIGLDEGVLLRLAGPTRVVLSPPLVITRDENDSMIAAILRTLDRVAREFA